MIIPQKQVNNFIIPTFGIGTWEIGGRETHNPQNNDESDIQSIREGLNKGLTYIDTAEMYAEGYAEILAAKAIKGYNRSELFITSKVWKTNLKFKDVIKAANRSLKRLEIDYIDLYLIHQPNSEISLKETMGAFDLLIENGIVKYIGVSNFTLEQLQEAQSYSQNKIVAVQEHYNLAVRSAGVEKILRHCQKHQLIFIAWRPLRDVIQHYNISLLNEICNKYNKTPLQIALNWLISQPNIITVSTMRTISHLVENLGAIGWEMTPEDIELLKDSYYAMDNTEESYHF